MKIMRSLHVYLLPLVILALLAATETVQAYSVQVREGNVVTFPDGPEVFCYARTDWYGEQKQDIPSQFNITAGGVVWAEGGMIALAPSNSWALMQTTISTTCVGVEFWGDSNDGMALVLVDGVQVWSGWIGSSSYGGYQVYIEVSDLGNAIHTLEVRGGGNGDVGIWYFGIGKKGTSTKPDITSVTAPDIPIQVGVTITYTVGGINFDPQIGASISGPGASVSALRFGSSNQLEVDIVYTAEASGATQTLTVTNPGGLSDSYSFSGPVFNLALVIHSIMPISAVPVNGMPLCVEYRVLGNNFLPGVTCSVSGPGVSLSDSEYVSDQEFQVTVVYATEEALKKNHYLTLINPGGFGDSVPLAPLRFSLRPKIEVHDLTSAFLCDGLLCVDILLQGNNFLPGVAFSISGPGTEVVGSEYVSEQEFHAAVRFTTEDAKKRRHSVALTNPGGFADSHQLAGLGFYLAPWIRKVTFVKTYGCGMDAICYDLDVVGERFLPGLTCSVSTPEVSTSGFQYVSESEVLVTISYYPAFPGKRIDLTLTNPGGFADTFSVH